MTLTAVLLPGLDGTGTQFAPLVACLSPDFSAQVVSYPNSSATYSEHVSIVQAALPKGGPYVLIAESYSGPVAIEVAASNPPGLVGLVLSATFLSSPSAALERFRFLLRLVPAWPLPVAWLASLLFGSYRTPELMALFKNSLAKVPPRLLLERLDNVARVDVAPSARKISVPTLYLRAKSDRIVPSESGANVTRNIKDITVQELEGPHFLLQANAHGSCNAIKSFARARVG